eukprot:m.129687 g.129687  ORF g.129687 m.129687 type:complete len:107 (-) comp13894_c0_seq2:316-636(-)
MLQASVVMRFLCPVGFVLWSLVVSFFFSFCSLFRCSLGCSLGGCFVLSDTVHVTPLKPNLKNLKCMLCLCALFFADDTYAINAHWWGAGNGNTYNWNSHAILVRGE